MPEKDKKGFIEETASRNVPSSDQSQEEKEIEAEKPRGILQRFKDAYKEYGKALIGVHLVTSAGWFGGFFYAASM